MNNKRIVITGIGLTAPNANNLTEFRDGLLNGKSGIIHDEIRHMGIQAVGRVNFDEQKYQKKKMRRRGTRAGSISIYCANEALIDAGIDLDNENLDEIGIYIGITEHGNVETEEEIHQLYQNDLKTDFWSHHHNPRTVANAPSGEVSLNLKITGPSYTLGGACAAGNLGLIHGAQMIRAGEIEFAIAGGVSESSQTFGIFAAFKSQGALGSNDDPKLACKPLDSSRNGIAISEGGCLYILETLDRAKKRGAKIYGEIAGYAVNSDASDFVLPNSKRQAQCMSKALRKANLKIEEIDILNLHATGTKQGDIQEIKAVKEFFENEKATNSVPHINATKALIGHAMGAAGSLELAGNIPSFDDDLIHPIYNVKNLDSECSMDSLVLNKPLSKKVNTILNNSFGMLGINSSIIIKKYNK